MVAFVSIVLALSLLGLIVYGLHKYQTMEVEYQVDRTMPLPPIKGDGSGKPQSARKKNAEAESKPKRSRIRNTAKRQDKPRARKNGPDQEPANTKANWQDLVTQAKTEGNFQQAYELCQQHYPLWGAFNQACIILRAQLKADKLPAEEFETLLNRLYRTAAIAELLHDKSDQAEHFKLHQLKLVPLPSLEVLEFPYQQLGYAQLRLIRKSDVKLMLSAWGRPDSHGSPRALHHDWWESQVSKLREH